MTVFLLDTDIAEIAENLGDVARDFSGRTILLTGGRGFLGRYFTATFRYLAEHVLDEPPRLIVLDNLITGDGSVEAGPYERFVEHDVIQPFDPGEPVHYILHAAGIASPFYYRAHPLETLEVATVGTKHMLAIAREHGARLLYFSSSEIYGDPDPRHVPSPESYRGNVACQGPRACYDEGKRVGETLCYIFHEYHGVPCNAVRPFNVYGPGMRETDYRVLPNFASRIKAGRPLSVYGTGNQTRTFCYVSDAINGFLRILARGVPGEVYNIGTPTPEISMLDLVHLLEKVLAQPVAHNVIEYPDSYPADEPNRRCPDIRKAMLQLEYTPQVELTDGLRRFFSWAERSYTGLDT